MTADRPTSRDVFLQGVADALAGTPHANHPVQFEDVMSPQMAGISTCTLCRAIILLKHEDEHRSWHDAHVRVHDEILREAQRYKSPPTYGGGR
jgi:hypothetical protein